MTLGKKQELFSRLIVNLMQFAFDNGYEIRCGDFFRDHRIHGTPGVKKNNSYSHKNSTHKFKLAGDLNLFKNGEFITTTEGHKPLGLYWESLHPLCRWGGRFNDANHYSLEHQGVK